MIHQDANKFSYSTLMGWLFAEKADNEVFVVFCMEHYKLVLSIGDAQTSQLQRDKAWKTIKMVLKRIHLKNIFCNLIITSDQWPWWLQFLPGLMEQAKRKETIKRRLKICDTVNSKIIEKNQ